MSHQCIADAFAPAEAIYREFVMQDTWGHLAPKKNKTYKGRFVYAIGCFGNDSLNPQVIVSDFGDLQSSPWFYEALGDFVDSISWKPEEEFPKRKGHGEEGCVYEWVGTFRNYKFSGNVRLILDANKIDITREHA